jgi:hypothetical protein
MGASKMSMAQKESFLAQMAKLSLRTVKTIDKALQLKQVRSQGRPDQTHTRARRTAP